MFQKYSDQLHDFIYQSISEGIPPLFFWIIFIAIVIIFVVIFCKLCMKIYRRQIGRSIIYGLMMLCMIPVMVYAILMMLTAHHIEHNQDVSRHQHTIQDIDANDKGGYTLELENHKKIQVKNIVDTHDKSLKNTSEPMSRGDKVTYYQSHSPHLILKAVIKTSSKDDNDAKQQL